MSDDNGDKKKMNKEYKGKEGALQRVLDKLKIKEHALISDAIKNIKQSHSIGFSKKGEKLFEMTVGELFGNISKHKNLLYLVIWIYKN